MSSWPWSTSPAAVRGHYDQSPNAGRAGPTSGVRLAGRRGSAARVTAELRRDVLLDRGERVVVELVIGAHPVGQDPDRVVRRLDSRRVRAEVEQPRTRSGAYRMDGGRR